MITMKIKLIKDSASLILAQKAQLSPTMILIYFVGLSILAEAFDRSEIYDNVDT